MTSKQLYNSPMAAPNDTWRWIAAGDRFYGLTWERTEYKAQCTCIESEGVMYTPRNFEENRGKIRPKVDPKTTIKFQGRFFVHPFSSPSG